MGDLLNFQAATRTRSTPDRRNQIQRHMSVVQEAVDDWFAMERLRFAGAERDPELDQAEKSISEAISSFLEGYGQAKPTWPDFVIKSNFKHASRCAFHAFKQLLPIFDREYRDPLLVAYAEPILNGLTPTRPRFGPDIDTFLSVFDFVQDMSDEIRRQWNRARSH